jgi:hypothetical protein
MRRRPLKATGFVVGGALLLLAGVAVAFAGHADKDRPALALMLVSFGVAMVGGGLLMRSPSRSPRDATRRGTVLVDGAEVPALVIPYSRYKQSMALVAGLGFVGSSIALLMIGRTAIGVLGLVTFGAMMLLGVRNVVTGARAALSERGVHVSGAGVNGWVPWDEIARVDVLEISNAPFVAIDASSEPRVEGPAWGRALARLNRRYADFGIPVDTIGVDPEKLVDTIEALARDPQARRGIAERGAELR